MKKYAWLIYIISCFFIGFIFTYLVYIGLWTRLMDGFKSVPVWLYVVLALITFYVTLTFHELGHLVAFKVQGVGIRALYLTIFVFYKDKKGWHATIMPKLWVLFGGLVVPDLPQVKTDEEMNHISKVFAKSLITAPIVTISLMIFMILSFFIWWIFGTGGIAFGVWTVSMIYTVILSSIYIYTFKLNTKHLYGDFVAYRKMKEDAMFQFVEIYQYQTFSLDADEEQPYYYQKAKSLLKDLPSITQDMFVIITLMAYLEGVIHHHEPSSNDIDEKLSKISIAHFSKTVEGLTLVYSLAEYYYINGLVEKAYRLIHQAKIHASKRLSDHVKTYLYKRAEHMMHIAYHDDFLSNKDNIDIGQSWLFEAIYDPYEEQMKHHEKLPFQVYVCDIPDGQEKMPSES